MVIRSLRLRAPNSLYGPRRQVQLLNKHNHKGSDFQSIILLPYIHVGSEKLWVSSTDWVVSLGIRPALELHLPIVDVMMSRTSWSQTLKQVRTVAGPFADKPLLRD